MVKNRFKRKVIDEHYDRFNRDAKSKEFYHAPQWKGVRDMKLRQDPFCEACKQAGRIVPAVMVHHTISLKEVMDGLDMRFLVSLCHAHHNQVESEMDKDKGRR